MVKAVWDWWIVAIHYTMKEITCIAAALFASASLALPNGLPNLQHEHPGDVFWQAHGGRGDCEGGVLHDVKPAGEIQVIDGRKHPSAAAEEGAKLTTKQYGTTLPTHLTEAVAQVPPFSI